MPPEETRAQQDRGRGAAVGDTVELVRRYVVQETVGPLRQIGKRLAFGAAGGLLLCVGFVVLLLAVLRVLQTETGTFFAGNVSFAPYLITAAVGAGVIAGAVVVLLRAINRSSQPGDR